VLVNVPTRHFYSPYATKTTLLHLLPTSSKVGSRRQSSVTMVMDQSLVEVSMICGFIVMVINHAAVLEAHINFPLVMSKTVNKQIIFLLVSANS
jgi:hypothetical protein